LRGLLIAGVGLAGCGSAPETEPFRERVVVFMEATPEEFDALRSTVPAEDFGTIADDLMFYRAEAHTFLEMEGSPVTTLSGRRPLAFVVSGEVRNYDFSELPTLDAIVAFEPGREPRAFAPVDVAAAVAYFTEVAGPDRDPLPEPQLQPEPPPVLEPPSVP
jgi:hypothetical protein